MNNPRGESAGPAARWHEIAQSPEFARLEALRRRITLTLLGVFTVCFGAFLICCGYARPFMSKSVDGGLTVAYTWLLALTVLAWALVWRALASWSRSSALSGTFGSAGPGPLRQTRKSPNRPIRQVARVECVAQRWF